MSLSPGLAARTITYATLFVGVVLVLLPARLVSVSPPPLDAVAVAGMLTALAGGAIAVWCIATFVVVGDGTPAPFDPPRRLVARGPYRLVRNPMYLAATIALLGAALAYRSVALVGYAAAFLFATHLFVVFYEEPTLRATFGAEYDVYCRRVSRWVPGR